MTVSCDFCGELVDPAKAFAVEVRFTATPAATPDAAFRSSFRIERVACKPECARNHGEGIDAGAIATRRALELRLAHALHDAQDRAVHLASELAIAKRGAVRYAARMVEHAATLCQRLPNKLDALTGIENFAKRLLALPEPPSRYYDREWKEARLEAMARDARARSEAAQ